MLSQRYAVLAVTAEAEVQLDAAESPTVEVVTSAASRRLPCPVQRLIC